VISRDICSTGWGSVAQLPELSGTGPSASIKAWENLLHPPSETLMSLIAYELSQSGHRNDNKHGIYESRRAWESFAFCPALVASRSHLKICNIISAFCLCHIRDSLQTQRFASQANLLLRTQRMMVRRMVRLRLNTQSSIIHLTYHLQFAS
jgi:hypothetical protein